MDIQALLNLHKIETENMRVKKLKSIISKLNNDEKEVLAKYIIYVYDKNIKFNIRLSDEEIAEILNRIAVDSSINVATLSTVNEILEFILLYNKNNFYKNLIMQLHNRLNPVLNIYIDGMRKNLIFSKSHATLTFMALNKSIGIKYDNIVKYIKPLIKNTKIYRRFKRCNKIILPYFPFSIPNNNKKEFEELINNNKETIKFVVQPKINGVRVAITADGRIYTKSHEIINISNIDCFETLEIEIKNLYNYIDKYTKNYEYKFSEEFIFDGVLVYNKNNCKKNSVVFHIFDYVEKDKFENFDFSYNEINDLEYIYRLEFLIALLSINIKIEKYFKHINLVHYNMPITTTDNYVNYVNKKREEYIKSGYSGIIIKLLDVPYLYGKTKTIFSL